jgi:hypothetical protein
MKYKIIILIFIYKCVLQKNMAGEELGKANG